MQKTVLLGSIPFKFQQHLYIVKTAVFGLLFGENHVIMGPFFLKIQTYGHWTDSTISITGLNRTDKN